MANIKCKVCGDSYHYCSSCPKDIDKPSWYSMFCSENCKDIFETLRNYFFKRLTKTEARNILYKLDLTKKNVFREGMQKQIEEIMAADVVVPEQIKEQMSEVVNVLDDTSVIEAEVSVVEEVPMAIVEDAIVDSEVIETIEPVEPIETETEIKTVKITKPKTVKKTKKIEKDE